MCGVLRCTCAVRSVLVSDVVILFIIIVIMVVLLVYYFICLLLLFIIYHYLVFYYGYFVVWCVMRHSIHYYCYYGCFVSVLFHFLL